MTRQQEPKYVVHHAEQSAIGDYAHVENYFSAEAAAADPGVAKLRRLFEEVNRQLSALEKADREQVAVDVEQAAKLAAEIQQGDEDPKKQTFLEARLTSISKMAPDIGEVIITTLCNPGAGIALTIRKIAQKALEGLKGTAPTAAA
jgi:hypothetical protein